MPFSIFAVVITFNRLELLKKVISALENQSYKATKIIVVNNGSTDGTKEWLETQPNLMVIEQSNVGSSGGQYTGIKAAFDEGAEWIWTMDDDVIPEVNCLEKLVLNLNEKRVHTPLRYTPENSVFYNDAISYNLTNPFRSIWNSIYSDSNLKEEYTEAVGITFEGPIFHRSLIEAIGLPEKKFFIFGDDTEFFIRAWQAGYQIFVVRDSKSKRQIPFDPSDKIFGWKNYYIIRNIIAIDVLRASKFVRFIRPFGYLLAWLKRCNNFSDVKVTFRAFKDGYFYKSEN